MKSAAVWTVNAVCVAAVLAAAPASAAPGEIPGRGFLPDDRGWEKVSPVAKNAQDVVGFGTHSTSPGGDRAVYVSHSTVPGAASGQPSAVLATRDPVHGWTTTPIDPPQPAGKPFANFLSFSNDLSVGILDSTAALTPDAVDGSSQLYLRDMVKSSYTRLTPNTLPPSILGSGTFRPAGATPDYSEILFEDNGGAPQTAEAVTGAINTYAWRHGELDLVGLVPPAGDTSCGAAGPTCVVPADGSRPGSGSSFASTHHAFSADGSRAFFHTINLANQEQADPTASSGGQLYVRDDHGTADAADDTTVHVSASQKTNGAGPGGTDPAGPLPALYWTAEAKRGSKVLFTSCEQLTNDSTATTSLGVVGLCTKDDLLHGGTGGATIGGRDLYAFDVDTGQLDDLTTADTNGAKVYGVVGASDDLTRIYFVAGGVLATGATVDRPNLYLWDDGTTRFIATLDENDSISDDPTHAFPPILFDPTAWAVFPRFRGRTVRVSADGADLLLASRAPLTSYDNASPSCYANRCAEVYRYQADAAGGAGATTCLSCRADGAQPRGDAALYDTSAGLGPADSVDPLAANLSSDGSRVVFETQEALAPKDTNSKVDVYEWEDGDVHLISTGTSQFDSHFADATPDGGSIFFTTRERLVSADIDEVDDMYVARIQGGFVEPPAAAEPCEADACQGAYAGRPGLVAPGSSLFSGAGDATPPKPYTFSQRRLTAAQRRALASGRQVGLKVKVSRAGTVSARATAVIAHRQRTVASGSGRAQRSGTVRMTIRLSGAARRQLARSGHLRVRLLVRFHGAASSHVSTMVLRT